VGREELAASGARDLRTIADSEALVLKEPEQLTDKDTASVDAAIEQNSKALSEMRKQVWKGKFKHLEEGLIAGTGFIVFQVVDGFVSVTNISGHSPLWRNLSLGGGGLFKDYAKMNLKAVFTNPADYKQAVATLKERIKSYRELSSRLKARHCEHCLTVP
jgi:hypothetical protein